MDIFVDVLLKHYKELTWMSISAELGCPADESKKLLMDIVAAALNSSELPANASIQCIFNGPAPGDPSTIQLVQTQAIKDNWPPRTYLSSVFGDSAVNNSDLCLQTVWLAAPNLEFDKTLVATDDLFHDVYNKAQRSASQNILYIAPFSHSIMSKLHLRLKGVGVSCGPSDKRLASTAQKQTKTESPGVPPPIKREEVPQAPQLAQEAPNTPIKPATKRRKTNSKKPRSIQEPTISPVVALGLTVSHSPCLPDEAKPEQSVEYAALEVEQSEASHLMDESNMPPRTQEATINRPMTLFAAEEDLDDGPPHNSDKNSPPKPEFGTAQHSTELPAQVFGQSRKTIIETSAKGGLGKKTNYTSSHLLQAFGRASKPVLDQGQAPPPRQKSGGGTLDAFFTKT